MSRALIVVDVQNDFLPGGALAVPNGDQVIPVINQMMEEEYDQIIATQDWHPQSHGSFASVHNRSVGEVIQLDGLPQFLWPVHCVQRSEGAEFAKALNSAAFTKVFRKGTDVHVDSYSGFFDNAKRRSTGLGEYLKLHEIEELTICGLATDYCVKFTVLDALELGFKVTVIKDACRGVNIHKDDVEKALAEMKIAGATLV